MPSTSIAATDSALPNLAGYKAEQKALMLAAYFTRAASVGFVTEAIGAAVKRVPDLRVASDLETVWLGEGWRILWNRRKARYEARPFAHAERKRGRV